MGVAACLAAAVLFAVFGHGTGASGNTLQQQNFVLKLQDARTALDAELRQFADATAGVAQSAAVARLLAETSEPPPAALLDGLSWAADGIDSIVVVAANSTVRYGAGVTRGRFVEGRVDPELTAYLAANPPAIAQSRVTFTGNRWFALSVVEGKSGVATVAGWVLASRAIAPDLQERLKNASRLRADVVPAAELPGLPIGVARQTHSDRARSTGLDIIEEAQNSNQGYLFVRDAAGHTLWAVRLGADSGSSAEAVREGNSAGTWFMWLVVSLLGCTALALLFMLLRRYLPPQRSADARYKAIIDQTNDGIVIVDAKSQRLQYCNPAFLGRLGYSQSEAQSLTLLDIFADGETPKEAVLARLRNVDSRLALPLQQRCKNGALLDIEVRCNALDVDGRDVLAYVTHDVSVRRKAEQQLIENQQRLDRMAHHDQLTGLPNRHYLASFLPQAIDEAKAGNSLLGVVFLDLDRFKHINDTRGHETGDKLLQEVATRLRACVRESDVVIRMGGDEFVVIFRNVKSYEEVTQGAARIIDTLYKPIVIDRQPLQTSGSVGVSLYPRDGTDMGELLKHSDTAMYQAKDKGRNNVQMFSQVMNRKLKHRVAMEASLREALRLKQFDVHYQPFVNLATRRIVGLEALMRWRHPVHGMIPADQFIPVAEETGLIVPMGNFVLHRALQTMAAWRKAGVALVPVSLNVAPAQLQRGEFQSTIATLLKTHGLRPDLLQLEMTERAVFDSTQKKPGEGREDTMGRLRDLGIKIAIDDFGTGYSSLSYLKNWRVDALKIDRSFVRDLVTDSSDLAIVSAIIAIARHLNIQVVAEGIEGYQQAEILRKLGCTVGQGFLFAKPMPAEECVMLLGDSAGEPEEEEDMLAAFAAGRA